MPAYGVEDLCSVSIRGQEPIKAVAPSILQADIDAAHNTADPQEAIQRLQKHSFFMKHPDVPGATGISRCGPPAMYRQLSNETAKIVSTLSDKYRTNRWFLSESEHSNPGLLRLLLISNQYEKFLSEAENFLLSAKDDLEASALFDRVHRLMSSRQYNLMQMQKSMNTKEFSHGFGLIDLEKKGIEILSKSSERIDSVRQTHVNFLLEKENKTFAALKNNPPPKNSQILLHPDLAESLTYIERSLKVALDNMKAPIRSQAEMHGDELAAENRHQEAIPYFKVAMAEEKLAKSKAIEASNFEARSDRTKRESKKELKDMIKTEKETEKFKNETDSLAEELGIDLDDF